MRHIKSAVILLLLLFLAYFIFQRVAHRDPGGNQSTPLVIPNAKVLKELTWQDNVSGNSDTGRFQNTRFVFTPEIEYGMNLRQSVSEIPSFNELSEIEVAYQLTTEADISENRLVVEIRNASDSIIKWEGIALPSGIHEHETITRRIIVTPDELSDASVVHIYFWNTLKESFKAENMVVRFLGEAPMVRALSGSVKKSSFLIDFESDSGLINTTTITSELSRSGRHAFYLSPGKSSPQFCKDVFEIINDSITVVSAGFWIHPKSTQPLFILTLEIRNSYGGIKHTDTKYSDLFGFEEDRWQKLNASFSIPPVIYRNLRDDDRICIYLLARDKTKFYGDDMEVSIGDIPEPRGAAPLADMNDLNGSPYSFTTKHPPFPFRKFSFADINNNNSKYLISPGEGNPGELMPNQRIYTGKFLDENRDALLVVKNDRLEVYSYCAENGSFSLGTLTMPMDKASEIVCGNFIGNAKEEVLLLGADRNTLFSIESPSNGCNAKPDPRAQEAWSGEPFTLAERIFCLDIAGDNYDELIVIDEQNKYQVLSFSQGKWNSIMKGSFPVRLPRHSSYSKGRFMPGKKDLLCTTSESNGGVRLCLIGITDNALKEIPIKHSNEWINISASDSLYAFEQTGLPDGIIAFNKRNRFDMRLLEIKNHEFSITAIPRFAGYPHSFEPRFYEYPRLITGNFTGTGTELLFILRNCADKNFDGSACDEYDSLPDLPNTIQLYTIPNDAAK